jgi:hypothetical protein
VKPDSNEPNKSLMFTGDFLIFLLVFIIIFGGALLFSITRNGLCARKHINESVVVPKTSLEQTLGHNPSFDILACQQ